MTDNLRAVLDKIAADTKILVEFPFDFDPNTPSQDIVTTKSELQTTIEESSPITLVSASGGVNIRNNSDITGTKIGEISGNVDIKATGEHINGFYRIEAWVSDQYAKPKPIDMGTQMYVIGDFINIREQPDATSTLMGKLNFRVGLIVIKQSPTPDNHIWGKIVSDEANIGINGYVATELLGTTRPPSSTPYIDILSRVGLHLYPPVGPEVLVFLKEMYDAGRPIRGVLLLKPSNISVADIKRVSPVTNVMVRRYLGEDNRFNPGNWPTTTRQDGKNFFNNIVRPVIDPDDLLADQIQPVINEPGYDIKGTINFWNGMLDVTTVPLGVFLFGVGVPPLPTDPPPQNVFWTQQPTIDLIYRVANETINSKHHKLAMHQYTNPTIQRPRYWNDTWTILRHQQILKLHPVYRQVRWVFPEFGDEKMLEQGAQFFIQNVAMADAAMSNDPVDWFALWTAINLGYDLNANWGHDNITAFLPNLKTYILGLG